MGASAAPPIKTSPDLWPDIDMISPEVWPDLPSVDTPAPLAGVVYVPVESYQQQQGAPTEDPGDEDDWDRLCVGMTLEAQASSVRIALRTFTRSCTTREL